MIKMLFLKLTIFWMNVPEMVIKQRDENILRAIERITSVYYLAWEIKRDIKEVHGTLGFDWIKKKKLIENWKKFGAF